MSMRRGISCTRWTTGPTSSSATATRRRPSREAAAKEGVSRIVYLGGLHPDDEELSPHLASRVEVGQIFLDAPVPAAVLQAAVVLGDGSASFDMLRYLTTRLPAMVAPKWLENKIQPIAVDDVLTLLAGAGELPSEVNRTFDIGGDEVLTYREMIARFSDATGRRRPFVVTVPVLTPRLASHWVGLVTPISAGLAKPLVGSLVHEVVAKERDIDDYVDVPGGYIDFDTAVRSAMRTAKPDTALRNLALTSAATVATAVAGSLATSPDSRVVSLARPARLAAAARRLPGRLDGALRRHRRQLRGRPQRLRQGGRRGGPLGLPQGVRHQPRAQRRVERGLLALPPPVGGRRARSPAHRELRRSRPPGRAVEQGRRHRPVPVCRLVRFRDRPLRRDRPPQPPLTPPSRASGTVPNERVDGMSTSRCAVPTAPGTPSREHRGSPARHPALPPSIALGRRALEGCSLDTPTRRAERSTSDGGLALSRRP